MKRNREAVWKITNEEFDRLMNDEVMVYTETLSSGTSEHTICYDKGYFIFDFIKVPYEKPEVAVGILELLLRDGKLEWQETINW